MLEQRFPLQRVLQDHGEAAVPLRVHDGTEIHLHPRNDPMLEQVDVPSM